MWRVGGKVEDERKLVLKLANGRIMNILSR
jgi:hypothetical protein